MAQSEQNYLLELWSKNICPFCGKSIPEGNRVGTGQRNKGGFCSLDCYTHYYEQEINERINRSSQWHQS